MFFGASEAVLLFMPESAPLLQDKRMGKSKTMKAKAKAETVNNGTPSKTTPEKRMHGLGRD